MAAEAFPETMMAFDERFHDEAACREYLRQVRWPDGWRCERCGGDKGWTTQRGLIHCAGCGHEMSVTSGTALHATKKPLLLWFKAMFLMTTSKNGLSASTLEKHVGISYATAWTWLQKLRQAMVDPARNPLSGVVEVDETYVGNDPDRSRGRRQGARRPVLIAVEEKGEGMGRIRVVAMSGVQGPDIEKAVCSTIDASATLHTDGWQGYAPLSKKGYKRRVDRINPVSSNKERAERAQALFPRVHLVASLLKRWLLGTHQGAVRAKHQQSYYDEFVFRFNRRAANARTLLFERLAAFAVRRRTQTYGQLVAQHDPIPQVVVT
jgi:hypothetical protein